MPKFNDVDRKQDSFKSTPGDRRVKALNFDGVWSDSSCETLLRMAANSIQHEVGESVRFVAFPDKVSSLEPYLIQCLTDVLYCAIQVNVAGRNISKCGANDGEPHDAIKDSLYDVLSEAALPTDAHTQNCDCRQVDKMGQAVQTQLRQFIVCIAEMYRRDNAFHNFEHAFHVVVSAAKLINRNSVAEVGDDAPVGLLKFAILFAALIHDVDHRGLTNLQLVENQDPLVAQFPGSSIAEQNSIHCAWKIFNSDEYAELHQYIYQSQKEKLFFRQIVVNAVMATDITDTRLQENRRNNFLEACREVIQGDQRQPRNAEALHRFSTCFSANVMQASDVAHTMQNWKIFRRWNQRLFNERYSAFLKGGRGDDPSKVWYLGEIWFYDNYVVPLARNLLECNMFGPPAKVALSQALENRLRWVLEGERIVREMVVSYNKNLEVK